MSTKKGARPAGQTVGQTPGGRSPSGRTGRPVGRPPKGESTASHTVSIRFTESDWTLVEELVKVARAAFQADGMMPEVAERVAAADVIRGLVRKEARSLGLLEPSPVPPRPPTL